MKKVMTALLALAVLLTGMSAAADDVRNVFHFVLFEIVENDVTYRVYGTNSLSMYLYPDDHSGEVYGFLFDDEKTDDISWEITSDPALEVRIGETTYHFDIIKDEEGNSIPVMLSGDRKAVYLLTPTVDEIIAGETEPPEKTTLPSEELHAILSKECPVESVLWTNSSIRYTFDGKARYRFDTDYGPFEYTLDLISGEILEKKEADLDAARAQEGFREPLTNKEVDTIVFSVCPVEASSADSISVARSGSGVWEYTIETLYGTFFYAVDGYTGEILDKMEPDMDEVMSQEGYTEVLDSSAALAAAEAACPLTFDEITDRTVGKEGAGVFVITLGSPYGEFIYKIDQKTGEVLERTEPEITERTTDSRALTDTGDGLSLAEKAFPLDSGAILSRTVNRGDGTVWTVTLGTAYGDFIYQIDPKEGTIIGSTEPDMEAARAQEGFREAMTTDEALRIAEEACPLEPYAIKDRNIFHRADNTWEITLGADDLSYFYVIDGESGEIIDSVLPEGAPPAPAESSDPFGEGIDAVFASFDNFDYTAENIRVEMTVKDGKDAVQVTLDWKGVTYVKYYILSDKTVVE